MKKFTPGMFDSVDHRPYYLLSKTEAEARYKAGAGIIAIRRSSEGKGSYMFFTDNACFGRNLLPRDWVPVSHYGVITVVPRPSLPDGVVSSIEDYLTIFGDGFTILESVEELCEVLNNK